MKVAMITPIFERCGVARYARDLVRAIRDHTNVDLYVIRHHRFGVTDRRYLQYLVAKINQIDPDVIHIQHEYSLFKPIEIFADFVRILPKPVIVTMHSIGHLPLDSALFPNPKVRYIIVPNEGMKKVARTDKAVVVPHMCPPIPGSKEEARKRLGIGDEFLAIHVGFIDYRKGTDVFLKVAQRYRDAKYVIVGGWHVDVPTEYMKIIKDMASKLGVRITGFVPDKEYYDWIQAADVIIQPCRFVSESYTLMECLSARKPVIVLNHPIFENRPVIKVRDVDGIIDAIKRVRRGYLPPGIEEFVNSRSPKKIARIHEDLYRRC